MNKDRKLITSAIIIGAVAFFLYSRWSHLWGTGMMYGWGGMGIGMGFFSLLFIAGLYLLFSDGYQHREDEHAYNILRERYARGELSEVEYMEMKKSL